MKLSIRIKPNSKSTALLKDAEGNWVLKVKSPPAEGRANAEVIRVISKILKLPQSAVVLSSGHTNPHKQLLIEGMAEDEVHLKLESALQTMPKR